MIKNGWRVLIVEDNNDNATILAMLLEREGHETQIANDGSEAVAKALEFCPEVILLDIGLPKINGYEVCRAIRGQPFGEDIIIIAVSGWQRDLQKSEKCRFDAYLLKPVLYDDLVNTITSIIRAGRYSSQEPNALGQEPRFD